MIYDIQQRQEPVALTRGLRKDRQIHFIKTAKAGLSRANQERFNKTVLVVRRIISKQGMVSGTEVDIKSTLLRDLLLEINEDVSGLQLNKSPPEVSASIQCLACYFWTCRLQQSCLKADPKLLFHSLPGLEAREKQELASNSPDQTLIKHISIAQQFVYEDFGSRIADLTSLLEHNEITYDLLWAIFPPRCLIFTKKTLLDQPQVMRVDSTSYQETQSGFWLELDCQAVAHDGEDFGTSVHTVKIRAFEGTLKVDDLDGFPLQYHRDEHSVRKEFIARGRKYVSMLGSECQEYSGPAVKEVDILGNNKIIKFTVSLSEYL